MRREVENANDGRAVDTRKVDFVGEWPKILEGSPIHEELNEAGMLENTLGKPIFF